MKLQFKHKEYQEAAVDDVVDCIAGQPKVEGITYRLDAGCASHAGHGGTGGGNAVEPSGFEEGRDLRGSGDPGANAHPQIMMSARSIEAGGEIADCLHAGNARRFAPRSCCSRYSKI